MTKQTKGDLAVLAVIGAVVAVLWWLWKRQAENVPATSTAAPTDYLQGMGTGLSGGSSPVLASAVPQLAFSVPPSGGDTYNIGGGSFVVGGAGGCGCNTCGSAASNGLTFGNADALANYLIASGQASYGTTGGTFVYV